MFASTDYTDGCGGRSLKWRRARRYWGCGQDNGEYQEVSPLCVTKALLLFFERLLLCLGPAVFAFLCFDTFKEHEPSPDNKNAGAFLLLAFGWFWQWKETWRLVPGRRGRAWAAAAAYCATMFVAGFVFFVWWPRAWAAWWVIIPTVLVLAAILSGDTPAGKTAGPRPEPLMERRATPAAEPRAVPAPASPALPVRPPARSDPAPKPRRRWPAIAGVTLLFFVVLGGAASYLFSGPGGAGLREQWRAYLGSGDAQLALGWRYREGDGKPQDYDQAARWFARAAKNGVARAAYDLGGLHHYGLVSGADPTVAHEMLTAAGDLGYAPALTLLGLIAQSDDEGTGRAIGYWERAAALHDPWGEHLLGSALLEQRAQGEDKIIGALIHLERARRGGVEPIKGMIEHVWASLPEADFERVADAVIREVEGEGSGS